MATITIRNCELAYDDAGPGGEVPFVWGHGLTSSMASEDEFPLVDTNVLRASRRVIRYDARGHGASGELAAAEEGGWDRLALDQVALLDALGVGDVVVGGASMGAATALHAAALLGDRLKGLVLVIPPTAWETRSEQAQMYETMANIVETKGVEPLIAASANMAPPDPFLADPATYKARRAESLRSADPTRLAGVFRGATGADFPAEDAVATIIVPTLILAWSGDPGHPVSTADRLAELMPHSEVSIAATMTDMSTWTEQVATFLDQIDARPIVV
jgi:pimeloyl-ACP methyl ester carboxylesterase